MIDINDLKEIKYYKYPLNTYAKIQSLKGCVDEIEITAEAYYSNQQVYITKYNKQLMNERGTEENGSFGKTGSSGHRPGRRA